MAIVVKCNDFGKSIEMLGEITKAVATNKIPDWRIIGENDFENTQKGYKDQGCFRPIIKEDNIFFGLVNPKYPPCSITLQLYNDYHSLFYRVLVHLSWLYYFTVEQTADRIDGIDAPITE
jgi:hypothetical protein